MLEAVEALPFATRDAEGIYIAEPVRRALVGWMLGVEPERYQLWRKTAADWIVSRLRATGRSGRWRYMADLLHLLEQAIATQRVFPAEEEAPPVEPALVDDFDQIFDIVEQRDGAHERARIEAWAQHLPHRIFVARGPEGEVLAFYLFARHDDPHSGLNAVDPLFAAWQAHLAAKPIEGEVLFIREMLARANGPHSAGRTACVLDLRAPLPRATANGANVLAAQLRRTRTCNTGSVFVAWNNDEPVAAGYDGALRCQGAT